MVPKARLRVGMDSQYLFTNACKKARLSDTRAVSSEWVLWALLERARRLDGAFVKLSGVVACVLRRRRWLDVKAGLGGPGTVGEMSMLGGATLREAQWRAFPPSLVVPPRFWSWHVVRALEASVDLARADGVPWLGPRHVVDGFLDPSNVELREFLHHCESSIEMVRDGFHEVWPLRAAGRPHLPTWEALRMGRYLDARRVAPRVNTVAMVLRYISVQSKSTPPVVMLEIEAVRQAVRLGHDRLTTAHLLLAVLSLNEQMMLAEDMTGSSDIVHARLAECGVTLDEAIAHLPVELERDAVRPVGKKAMARPRFGGPAWSSQVVVATDQAGAATRNTSVAAQVSAFTTAAVSDNDGAAAELLRRMGVSPGDVI